MRYLGSKAATAHAIHALAARHIASGTFCDPFGGVGVVGARFKECGFRVTSGDILKNAYNFQVAKIVRNRRPAFSGLQLEVRGYRGVEAELNRAVKHGGWFEREYAIRRNFFTPQNARRIAGCRAAIRRWNREGQLTGSEHAVLLASLVASMDRVANTAGTYYAYLKTWYRKALRPFQFQLLTPTLGTVGCSAHLCPAEDLVANRDFDILYLDPPYNDRNYGGYYHLPETIAIEGTPHIGGLSGIPSKGITKSHFNSSATALEALAAVVSNASFRLLLFHYADDGLIERQAVRQLLRQFGIVTEHILSVRSYSTQSGRRIIRQRLYLVKNG